MNWNGESPLWRPSMPKTLRGRVEALEHSPPANRPTCIRIRYIRPPRDWSTAVHDKELGVWLDREVYELPESERLDAVSVYEIDPDPRNPQWPEHEPGWVLAPDAVLSRLDAGDPALAKAEREALRSALAGIGQAVP
jgi:hypothetical protein